MKTLLLVVFLIFEQSYSIAGDKGNGGDPCENEILEIRDDIKSWIKRGGHINLSYPDNLTSSGYAKYMNDSLDKAKVSCSQEPVLINGTEKTCINISNKAENSFKIICNHDRFMSIDIEKKYKLVHHEYAGIAGFEVNKEDVQSNYFLSNQLGAFLAEKTVKKLAIKPLKTLGYTNYEESEVFKSLEVEFNEGELPDSRELNGWFAGKCYGKYAVNYMDHAMQVRGAMLVALNTDINLGDGNLVNYTVAQFNMSGESGPQSLAYYESPSEELYSVIEVDYSKNRRLQSDTPFSYEGSLYKLYDARLHFLLRKSSKDKSTYLVKLVTRAEQRFWTQPTSKDDKVSQICSFYKKLDRNVYILNRWRVE